MSNLLLIMGLYQLRNVINRKNVVAKPLKDFNACDDFFVLVVKTQKFLQVNFFQIQKICGCNQMRIESNLYRILVGMFFDDLQFNNTVKNAKRLLGLGCFYE